MTQKQKTHHLAVAAMLSAVAAVLQFVEFSIPIMPSFIKLDISDLPALLGTFSLGPVYGVAIQLVKNLLHLPFGSSAGVGELSNFILGAIFVFAAGMVYKRKKSRKSALTGSVIGAAFLSVLPEAMRDFATYRMLAYSVVLVLVMLFRPGGIFGHWEFSLIRLLEKRFGRKTVKEGA